MNMVNIFNVLAYLLLYFIITSQAKTTSEVEFCEEDQITNINLNCSEETLISVEITFVGYSWCSENIKTSLDKKCIGLNSCNFSSAIFSGCERIPQYLSIKYKCRNKFSSWFDYDKTVKKCASRLEEVTCFFTYRIQIMSVDISHVQVCINKSNDEKDANCAREKLQSLCNNERRCRHASSFDSCLFHRHSAIIKYSCGVSSSRDPYSNTIGPMAINTSEDPTIDASTESSNPTDSRGLEPSVHIAEDGIVIVFEPNRNKNFTVCSIGWDDTDADVLCKHLNSLWSGTASSLEQSGNYTVIPFSVNCDGSESSPFECNFTVLENNTCNSMNVAGVSCCKHGDDKCTFAAKFDKSEDVGLAVGAIFGVLIVVCCVVGIIYFLRRSSACKGWPIQSRKEPDDSLRPQGKAFPKKPNDHQAVRFINDNCINNSNDPNKFYSTIDQVNNIHPEYELAKPIAEDSSYAKPEEGVYDKSREPRHAGGDTHLYSHAIDGVYDTSKNTKQQARTCDAYEHVTV